MSAGEMHICEHLYTGKVLSSDGTVCFQYSFQRPKLCLPFYHWPQTPLEPPHGHKSPPHIPFPDSLSLAPQKVCLLSSLG